MHYHVRASWLRAIIPWLRRSLPLSSLSCPFQIPSLPGPSQVSPSSLMITTSSLPAYPSSIPHPHPPDPLRLDHWLYYWIYELIYIYIYIYTTIYIYINNIFHGLIYKHTLDDKFFCLLTLKSDSESYFWCCTFLSRRAAMCWPAGRPSQLAAYF